MKARTVILALCLVSLSGCAQMFQGLRRGVDDPQDDYANAPTIGGAWAASGMLDNGQPEFVDRGPASEDPHARGDRSWVTPEDQMANARDQARWTDPESDPQGFSENPNMPPPVRRKYKNGSRATAEDFVDDSAGDGSLWASDGQTNYYFTKNKVRGVGDIITINVQPDLLRDARTEVIRTLSPHEREIELELAQQRLKKQALVAASGGKDQLTSSSAAPVRAPAQAASSGSSEVKVPEATLADIDVSSDLDLNEKDTIMAEIVRRYPNGNYKIRGIKRMRYRNGFRMLSVLGIVKGADISENDTVDSSKLYEYRLEVMR